MSDQDLYVRTKLLTGWKIYRWSGAVPANYWLGKKHCQDENIDHKELIWPMEAELVESSHTRTYPSLCPGKTVTEDFQKVYAIKKIDWRKAFQYMTWKKYYSNYNGKRKINFYRFEGQVNKNWICGGTIGRINNTDNFKVHYYHHEEKDCIITQKQLSIDLKLWQQMLSDHFKEWLNRRYKENKVLRNIK